MPLMPVPQTQAELVETLREMATLVEVADSFEGFIEYQMPDERHGPEVYALVKASYRIGNRMGQGGMRMLGEIVMDEQTKED